ncbi:MAG: hypothetical protein IKS39_09815 [Clostridia bacterium]|nr:hypothetical protein [Clostridia bacterium]
MTAYWSMIMAAIVIMLIIIPARNKFIYDRILRKKRGRKTKVTIDMITDLVGKDVIVTCFNESFARQCTVIAVEENWIKVEDKKKISIINADMIRDITIIKPKNA